MGVETYMIGAELIIAAHMYTVKPGDYLSKIVGNQWPIVCQVNQIKNCDLIYPGQQLIIPPTIRSHRGNDGDSDRDDGYVSRHSAGYLARHSNGAIRGNLGCNGLESLWIDNGGNSGAAFVAAEIAMAESSGQQFATGHAGEKGYWQISPDHGSLSTYDANGNARAAIIISDNGSNWDAWTTFHSGAYLGKC